MTIAFQSGLQGLAVATGLFIIHAISKEEYGLYAMVASVQGMASVLADSGIVSATNAFLGKTWEDRAATLGVISAAYRERRRLLIAVLPLSALILFSLAYGKTSMATLMIMEATLLCCIWFDVGAFLYQMALPFTGKRTELQLMQMAVGIGRISVIAVLFITREIGVIELLVLNAMCSVAGWIFSRRLALGKAPPEPVFHPDLKAEIYKSIQRMLPITTFYAFQGQIMTYVISFFGTLADVASVAALSRIGLIFSVLLNVISLLGNPAFSKAKTKAEGLRIFWAVTLSGTVFSILFYVASLIVPGLMLLLLGSRYASLTVELQLTVVIVGLNAIGASIWGLFVARGMVRWPWIYISVTILIQVVYAILGDLHTVRGVLWLGVFTSAASLLNMIGQAYWFILRPRELGRN